MPVSPILNSMTKAYDRLVSTDKLKKKGRKSVRFDPKPIIINDNFEKYR